MLDRMVPRTLSFADCIGVFQGGGCRAAAHAGAYAAAKSRGVHFYEVAGTSAGAIVAVLVAAGAEPDWLRGKVAELDFRSFLQPAAGPTAHHVPATVRMFAKGPLRQALTLWQHQALYSGAAIRVWVEACLRELLPEASRPDVLFRDLRLPVSIMAANLRSGLPKTYGRDATPDEPVAKAVQASCTLPFFFQPIDGLVDGGLLSNLPIHLIEVDPHEPSRILAFALEDGTPSVDPHSLQDFTAAMATTVVRGAQKIQEGLQSNVSVIRVNTGETRATDFDKMDQREAQRLYKLGEAAANKFLDRENLESGAEHPRRTYHEAQTYDVLAYRMLAARQAVQVATSDTAWSAELFSAIWLARSRGVRIDITVTSSPSHSPRAVYQRELLSALGCSVEIREPGQDVPVDAWLFDPATERAVALVPTTHGSLQATVHTLQSGEGGVLSLLQAALERGSPSDQALSGAGLVLRQASERDVVEALLPVDQYIEPAKITLEEVELDRVDSWAKYALSYKQRQQEAAARLFRDHQLEAFRPAWLTLSEGRRTLLLPPVVEASRDGHSFTVVNGASRLLLLNREGRRTAWCAVVRDVGAPPPADTVRPVRQLSVRIGRKGDPTHRYDGFKLGHVRLVERFAHTSEVLEASREMEGGG